MCYKRRFGLRAKSLCPMLAARHRTSPDFVIGVLRFCLTSLLGPAISARITRLYARYVKSRRDGARIAGGLLAAHDGRSRFSQKFSQNLSPSRPRRWLLHLYRGGPALSRRFRRR